MTKDKLEEIKANFNNNLKELKNGLNHFLPQTKDIANTFGGPSIYFHNKALYEMRTNFLKDSHIEMIYAVLPSWGMHRMGDTSTKVIDFDKFKEQIEKNREKLLTFRSKNISEIDINELSDLLINKLHFTESKSYLVSSSKVLHHIIPNLVSPIDKQYNIRFLLQNKEHFITKSGKYSTLIYDNNEEINYSLLFLSGMHNFIEETKSLLIKYLDKDIDLNKNFNTSLTKLFDNLIMVYVKEIKK
jgi:hypothetical protein